MNKLIIISTTVNVVGGLEIVGMQEKTLKLKEVYSGQKFLQAGVKAW